MRRKFTAIVVSSAVLLGAGVVAAAPAQAATNYTTTITCSSGTLVWSSDNIATATNDTITITNSTSVGLARTALTGGTGINSLAAAGPMSSGTLTVTGLSGGTLTLQQDPNGACSGATTTLTFSGGSSGGGGGSSSSGSATPVTETLSLSVAASGATCTGGNPSGTSGSWLTLPGADQCSQSGPTAKAGSKLLGWATSANFPIARAQAQIDKKWGVIDEVIDGQRMIFIPGGMATFVSGSNNLFPIWSA